jgi:hypothetical protein
MSTSLPQGSPASRSASRVRNAAARTSGGSGRTRCELFARYVHRGRYWRTCQASSAGNSQPYSRTWPASGTTRSGRAYRHPRLVPITGGTAYLPLPTPTANIAVQKGDLHAVVNYGRTYHGGGKKRWPTPKATDAERGGRGDLLSAVRHGKTSRRKEWPTPTANRRSGLQSHGVNALTGPLNPVWVEWLMGFPPEWTGSARLATRSSRRSRST